MPPENDLGKPIHLGGEELRIQEEIRKAHGVILSDGSLRALVNDPEAAAYLRGFQYYLDHKEKLLKEHRDKWVAITGTDGVIAKTESYAELDCKVEEEYPGIRSFRMLVRTPGRIQGILRPPLARRR